MKTILSTAVIAFFAVAIYAQESTQTQLKAQEVTALKTQIQAEVKAELDALPAQIQAQVQAAKASMEQVQALVATMKAEGKSKKEINDALEQKKLEAQEQLKLCIEQMDGISTQVKAQVEKASQEIQTRLQERAGEMKAVQNKKPDNN